MDCERARRQRRALLQAVDVVLRRAGEGRLSPIEKLALDGHRLIETGVFAYCSFEPIQCQ
jgi:hypothetical protein